MMDFMRIQKRYWNIAKRLTTAQLQRFSDDDAYQLEEKLFNVNIGRRGNNLFMGYYSREGLELVFKKYGVYKTLRRKGYFPILLSIDTGDPYIHKLSIHYKERKPDYLLAEIVLKREIVMVDMPFPAALNGKKYYTLSIEWMALQNPSQSFSKNRPPLPGQQHPGLGMASKAVELLILMSWRLKLGGLLNTPEYYHNAHLYSKIFFYINPEHQAKLKAMQRDMTNFSLDQVAWALEWGLIKDINQNKPLKWFPGKQIVPLEEELKKLFNSRSYRKMVKEHAKQYKFELDINKYNEMKEKRGNANEA